MKNRLSDLAKEYIQGVEKTNGSLSKSQKSALMDFALSKGHLLEEGLPLKQPDMEMISEAATHYANSVQFPLNQTKMKLRIAFREGAKFMINQVDPDINN